MAEAPGHEVLGALGERGAEVFAVEAQGLGGQIREARAEHGDKQGLFVLKVVVEAAFGDLSRLEDVVQRRRVKAFLGELGLRGEEQTGQGLIGGEGGLHLAASD